MSPPPACPPVYGGQPAFARTEGPDPGPDGPGLKPLLRAGTAKHSGGVRALVLYESLFGNTAAVAEAVAAGMRSGLPDAAVDCRRIDDAFGPDAFDVLVLGAPTHFWSLTGTLSRTMESQYERRFMAPAAGAATRQATATSGMRNLLGALPPGGGHPAAAFDTCMSRPATGGARRAIQRRLERAGYGLLAAPESFLVEAVAGPLRPGELGRARAWGEALARALDERDGTNWRTTMERDTTLLTGHDRAAVDGVPVAARQTRGGSASSDSRFHDVARIVTTTEVVVGAVLVARYLSSRPGSSKALVTMGPGGWVSMKGGTVAVRRGSRPWARPTPVQAATTGRPPLWARVLSAVPLQALMR
jgi:Flavodoxin domain